MNPSLFASELFQPDLFSDPVPCFAAAPEAEEEIRGIVRRYFPSLGSVFAITQALPVGVNSRVFKFQASSGAVILKKIPGKEFPDIASLHAHLARIERLRGKGAPMLEILVDERGALVSEVPGGYVYLMRALSEMRYLGADEQELCESFVQISRLFHLLEHENQGFFLPAHRFFEPDEREAYETFYLKAKSGRLPAFVEPFWPALEKTWRVEGSGEALPESLCHMDIHPHNILISKGKAAFLDLESIRPCWKMASLGFAVYKLLRNFMALSPDRRNLVSLRSRICEGLIQGGRIRREELPLLVRGARLENIKRFLLILTSPENIQKWQARLPIFGRALAGEIDVIFGSPA